MNEFHDPDLENLLGRTGGPFPDVNVAYQQVQGRVRQVKRRRAVVVSGAACSLLFAAAVFAGTRPQGDNTVRPGGSSGEGRDSTEPDQSLAPTPGDSDPTDSSVAPATNLGGNVPVVPPTSATPGGSTPGSSTPVTTPTTTRTPTPTTTASTTASTTAATTASTPPAPVTQTYNGVGGSVTVRMQNGTLTLLSSSPAGGFTADVRQTSGGRVEVRFESGTHRTEIRVDLVGNSMVPDIREQAN